MNKHVNPAFEWFMVFSHMHYKPGKKCVFYDGVTSWHQHSCRWAECTLSWGESGFSTAVPSRNKDWTRSTVKEEITYLHCQIAAPSTVLVVVISSAERGLVVSYWSVANQIVFRTMAAASRRYDSVSNWSSTRICLIYSMNCQTMLKRHLWSPEDESQMTCDFPVIHHQVKISVYLFSLLWPYSQLTMVPLCSCIFCLFCKF